MYLPIQKRHYILYESYPSENLNYLRNDIFRNSSPSILGVLMSDLCGFRPNDAQTGWNAPVNQSLFITAEQSWTYNSGWQHATTRTNGANIIIVQNSDTLTLMLLVANHTNTKSCENHEKKWNPGTWVRIWEYSARVSQCIPTWQGFQKSLRSCAVEESSLSIRRVRSYSMNVSYCKEPLTLINLEVIYKRKENCN